MYPADIRPDDSQFVVGLDPDRGSHAAAERGGITNHADSVEFVEHPVSRGGVCLDDVAI